MADFLQIPEIIESQASKYITHNTGVRRLRILAQLTVLDRDLTTPPTSPTAGDAYIVATSATGDWAGNDGAVAYWTGPAWEILTPGEGWMSWVADEDVPVVYTGTAWEVLSLPQTSPISGWVAGALSDGQTVLRYVAAEAMTIPAGMTGSQGSAGTAATASTEFTVSKNGTSAGTMTFAASGTTATFAAASDISLAAGDVLTVAGPATADATLADVAVTILVNK